MKTSKLLSNFIFFFIVITFLFGRSFMGIYILNFRIGELIVLISVLSYTLLLFKISELNSTFNTKILFTNLLIIFSFLVSAISSNTNFFNPYTFKSSNYIWAVSFIYIGYFFAKNYEHSKTKQVILNFSLVYLYFLSTVNYPNFIINFFQNYSDKWDFNKASSLVLCFVVVSIFNNKYLFFKLFSIDYFLLVSSLFLPLILFKSRGSFIGLIVFIILQLFVLREKIYENKKRFSLTLLVCLFTFFISSFIILDQDPELLLQGEIDLISSSQVIEKLTNQKDTKVESFISFYIFQDRVYSVDGNVNWRIQIWQDVIFDQINESKSLFGYGYSEMIPAMTVLERQGRDGLNENVHNFIINIIARGGLFQFIIYMFFFFYLVKFQKDKFSILSIIFPLFTVSFFDASMENSHFPIIFYLFIGYFFNNKNITN